MATVKGQNLRVFIGSVVVAAAQACTLNVRLDVRQLSTKDDIGSFATNEAVRLSWSVQTNGLVTIDPDRNDPTTLMDRIGQTVRVELATAGGEMNSEQGSHLLLAGDAVISDVQIQATNDEESTYAVTLTGKRNMLISLQEIITADSHNIRTASGHIVVAEHEEA